MKAKHLISNRDLSSADWAEIFKVTAEMKQSPQTFRSSLNGKTLGMIFEKRSGIGVAFEVGMYQLGGTGLVMDTDDVEAIGGKSTVDVARTLSRYVDAIVARVDAHADVVELSRHATVPVINAGSDLLNPCQALSDYFTLSERKGALKGHKLAYLGDGNNMCHSLLYGANKVGIDIAIATPKGYEPKSIIVKSATREAKLSGVNVTITVAPDEAVQDADAVYTDVWAPTGQEGEAEKRSALFKPYQVNALMMARAKSDAVFMHCLPARREQEVTAEVLDGPQSIILDQAQNRLHLHKAILHLFLG